MKTMSRHCSRGRLVSCLLVTAVALQPAVALAEAHVAVAGDWEGCWESWENGHHGTLRATITPIDETHYCARFSGTFFKVLPFHYSVVMQATGQGDVVTLEGTSDLGFLFGGTYSFHATVTPHAFTANYCSPKDHGFFTLSRSSECNSPCSCQ